MNGEPERAADLERLLEEESRAAGGALPFARFMELALYAPGLGYYETERNPVGRQGDFYTSVSVGPCFGELLLEALRALGLGGAWHRVIEAGAHDGTLAHDLLRAWKSQGPAPPLDYWIVEPSPRRRRQQEETLRPFKSQVHWVESLPEWSGLLVCNELLDAFPAHRLGWDAVRKEWFEWGVERRPGGWDWTRLPLTSPELAPREFDLLRDHLPEGWTVERSPAAEGWWRDAAGRLTEGRMLAFDYGVTLDQYLSPERPHGTLRAYRDHRPASNLLASPGAQDLTGQVQWFRIEAAGVSAGMVTERFCTQEQFFTPLAARMPAAYWTPERLRQFQTLVHPSHLGRRFQVLQQRKQIPATDSCPP